MKITISPKVVSRVIDGEAVILSLEKSSYFGLNEIGTLIWQSLEKGSSLDEIVSEIMEEYNVTRARAEGDLANLLEALKERGLVEVQ